MAKFSFMKILVTGANGFIGQALCKALSKAGYTVCAAVRSKVLSERTIFPACIKVAVVGDIDSCTDWEKILHGIDVVVHTAARVHQIKEKKIHRLTEYDRVNTAGTVHLFKTSAKFNVKQFIFLSSIHVNGYETFGQAFTELNRPEPWNEYAISKWKAEQGIMMECQAETSIKYTILRLPLVYGWGVKANFERLLKLVRLRIPLPLGAVSNKRSLLYIGNLISAVLMCIKNPRAMNQTYLLSDKDDISTPQLIYEMARHYGIKPKLWSISPGWLKWIAYCLGKEASILPLLNSLQLDSGKIRNALDWEPPYTLSSGLAEMFQKDRD